MTVLELKHQLSRLNSRQLREIQHYLIRLRHSTPEWRQATARKLRAVERGKFVSAEELESRIAR